MPIEIRELIIRATITGGAVGEGKNAAVDGDAADDEEKSAAAAELDTADISDREIIAECVEQVLKILERQKER